jgi:RsiW-degrading membrane proteinase PrsW (M82 family)
MSVNLYRGKRLLSRRRYYILQGGFWIYFFLYLLFLWYYFDNFSQLGITLKIVIGLFLLGAPPSLTDLLCTYRKYQDAWSIDNKSNAPGKLSS